MNDVDFVATIVAQDSIIDGGDSVSPHAGTVVFVPVLNTTVPESRIRHTTSGSEGQTSVRFVFIVLSASKTPNFKT